MLTFLFIPDVTTTLSQVRNSNLGWLPSTKDKRVFSSWSRLKNKFASSFFFTWCRDRVNMIKNKLYPLESKVIVLSERPGIRSPAPQSQGTRVRQSGVVCFF